MCAGCCAALDHLVTYIFKKVTRVGRKRRSSGTDPQDEETCLRVLKLHPEILQQVVQTILLCKIMYTYSYKMFACMVKHCNN